MEPSNKKPKMNKGKRENSKKNYYKLSKKLQPGNRGFLITCNMNEQKCIRESYGILNRYADMLYKPEESKQDTNDEDSDSDDLDACVAKCKEEFAIRRKRLRKVDTGTQNCLFIRTKFDPLPLAKQIVDDITATGEVRLRFLLRLVPIEVVCRANMPDIVNAAGALFDKHFLKEPSTFGIIFNHRCNQDIKRDQVIKELAALVNSKNVGNKVDLHHAKKSIIVEVLRGMCLLSVIDNYLDHKKYNLIELAAASKQKANGELKAKSEKAENLEKQEESNEDTAKIVNEEKQEKSCEDTDKIVEIES